MTDFLSLLTAIPSLISNFSGTANPYGKQQKQLADQQGQVSQALLQGPGNSLYNNIYSQYKQQGQNNLASQIAELQGQNRMNLQNGRTPLFSQDRGGEQLFRALTQGQQNMGVQADQQTRLALQGAGNQTIGGIGGYNSIASNNKLATAQGLSGYQGIYDLLRGNMGQSQQMRQPSTGSSGAGNYSPVNQNYVNPNANLFPNDQSYGLGGYGGY